MRAGLQVFSKNTLRDFFQGNLLSMIVTHYIILVGSLLFTSTYTNVLILCKQFVTFNGKKSLSKWLNTWFLKEAHQDRYRL